MVQAGAMDATQASMREYLDMAVMQAEFLPKILHGLQAGSDLSLAAWRGGAGVFKKWIPLGPEHGSRCAVVRHL